MPFKCIQKGGKWVCISEDTGKEHGRHDTKGDCEAQRRAISASYYGDKKKR
jgi:hypothetical protein